MSAGNKTGSIAERPLFERFLKNAGILLGGGGVASLLGFATLALNARALGPELLGILALLQSFAAVVARLFTFDTWQPVIKFGAQARNDGDNTRLRDTVALGFVYDFGGTIAATLAGLVIAVVALPAFDIASEHREHAIIFALTLLFGGTSAATGVLRLFGRFGISTGLQVAASLAALIAAVLLAWRDASFHAYVVAYASIGAAQSCAVILAVLALWRREGLPSITNARFSDAALRGSFAQFSWSTSALSSINVVRQNADAFALAALLGPAAAGIYKVATQVATLVTRFGDPLQQALFPEIATLIAKGDLGRLRRILVRAFFAGTAVLLVVIAGAGSLGELAVVMVGGHAYADAAGPLAWLAVAYGLAVAGFYIRPTVVTLAGPLPHLYSYFAATLLFIPALYFGITHYGVAGAGLSQVAFTVIWFLFNGAIIAIRMPLRLHDLGDGIRDIVGLLPRPMKPHAVRLLGRSRVTRRVSAVRRIAQVDKHVWAGYYDLPVFSPSGDRITYHAWRPGTDTVEFGTFHLRLGTFDALGTTRAWSFQLATRLQFVSEDVVLHYDEVDGRVSTRFRRLSDGVTLRRLEGLAYYSITPSGSLITSLNYAHIRRHRSGYGFEHTNVDASLALSVNDLRTPDARQLWQLDLAACAELAKRHAGDALADIDTVHLNHTAFSNDESSLAFVIASFGSRRRQLLFVARMQDEGIIACPLVTASHYCWTDNDEISVFGQDDRGIMGYWYWSPGTNALRPMGPSWPQVDGHQSRHPAHRDAWVTDSYPDRLGYQSLYLLNGDRRDRIGDFQAPLGMAADKCDLHPRWSSRGDMIAIDTASSGLRQTLVLTLRP